MANNNVKSAEENLRCAQIGFREGVIPSTDVMAAQTAWQKAHSDKIDAEVDLRVSEVNLEKALGILEKTINEPKKKKHKRDVSKNTT